MIKHYGQPYGGSAYEYMLKEYQSMVEVGYSHYDDYLKFKEKRIEEERTKKIKENIKERTKSIKNSLTNLINK